MTRGVECLCDKPVQPEQDPACVHHDTEKYMNYIHHSNNNAHTVHTYIYISTWIYILCVYITWLLHQHICRTLSIVGRLGI